MYNWWRGPPCFQPQVSRLLSRCPPPVPWPTRRWGWQSEKSAIFLGRPNPKNDLKKKHAKTQIEEITIILLSSGQIGVSGKAMEFFWAFSLWTVLQHIGVYTCSLFNLRPNCLYYLFDNPKITSPTLRHLIFDMNFPQFFQPKDAPGCVLFPTFAKLPKKMTGPSTCVDLRLGRHALPNKLDASLGLVGISTMFLFIPTKNEWCYALLCWITKAFNAL